MLNHYGASLPSEREKRRKKCQFLANEPASILITAASWTQQGLPSQHDEEKLSAEPTEGGLMNSSVKKLADQRDMDSTTMDCTKVLEEVPRSLQSECYF